MKVTLETFERPIVRWLNRSTRIKMEKTVSMLCEAAKARFLPNPPRRGDRPIVRTGRLRDSLVWEVRDDGRVGWYGSNRPWRGENSVYYAVFLELGFRHWRTGRFVGPYPFLRPPLITKKAEVQRIWGGEEMAPKARGVFFVKYES